MEKNLKLKQNFTVSFQPNKLYIKVIGDASQPQVQIYYELIYDHFEDEPVNTQVPQENEDGSVSLAASGETQSVFKFSIPLYRGNESIPAQFLIPLLSGDKQTTNQILAGFEWSGLFEGLVMEME